MARLLLLLGFTPAIVFGVDLDPAIPMWQRVVTHLSLGLVSVLAAWGIDRREREDSSK